MHYERWQTSIMTLLDDENNIHGNFFHYVLPRQCGATMFLCDLANRKNRQGNRVLYLTHNRNSADYLHKILNNNIKILPLSEDSNLWTGVLDRYSPNWEYILCDNISIPGPSDWMISSIKRAGKKVLWIDTKSGEK